MAPWCVDQRWRPLHPDDVSEYLKAALGEQFSAKDFQTWNATVRCAVELGAKGPPPDSQRLRLQRVAEAIAVVAELLANTTTVCRRSYVDPRVIEAFLDGESIVAEGNGERARARLGAAVLARCERRSH